MEKLAQKFLTPDERKQIMDAVAAAEKTTAGEIVAMVVSASDHYPMAIVRGAALLALPVAVGLTEFIGEHFWIGPRNMWLFIAAFTVSFALIHRIMTRTIRLRRLFLGHHEVAHAVESAALTAFYREGLYRTRHETGVLLFVSVFERQVHIVADRGIHAKMETGVWQSVVDRVIAGIRVGRPAEAICAAVGDIGRLLATHFPIDADDTNELKSLIIED